MTKIFQHSAENNFHVSVGAILVNSDGKILVHKLVPESVPEQHRTILGGLDCAYILMRESLENGESLETAVLRGLAEEFGVEGKIIKYLGSTQATLPNKYGLFEKTTLYFEVEFIRQGDRAIHDWESETLVEWLEPAFLIEEMRKQGRITDREDLDESKIIEAYVRNK